MTTKTDDEKRKILRAFLEEIKMQDFMESKIKNIKITDFIDTDQLDITILYDTLYIPDMQKILALVKIHKVEVIFDYSFFKKQSKMTFWVME